MAKTRVLILSSSTGGGHDMRARAFRDWAAVDEKVSLEVRQYQALESSHGFYRFGVELYNVIQRHAPLLHHLYFNELEWLSLFRNPDRLLGKESFCQLLRDFQPQVLLSVHGSTNHGFFELARRTLGADRVRCVTYCGELFGGYGFSRHWVNPQADLFIGAVPETCEAASHLGMPKERNQVGGFLLRPEFYHDPLSKAQVSALAERLHLDPRQFILLLSTGANGANNHVSFLRALAKINGSFQVIVLCGKDEKTLKIIDQNGDQWPRLTVRALGRREDMAALMQLATVIVARPGTGTTSEAIQLGCPVILNGLGGIMPQEWITVKYCRRHGLGEAITRSGQLAGVVERFLMSPGRVNEVRNKMSAIRPRLHPCGILEMVRGC